MGGRGWGRNRIIRLRESLALYKSSNTLWTGPSVQSKNSILLTRLPLTLSPSPSRPPPPTPRPRLLRLSPTLPFLTCTCTCNVQNCIHLLMYIKITYKTGHYMGSLTEMLIKSDWLLKGKSTGNGSWKFFTVPALSWGFHLSFQLHALDALFSVHTFSYISV